MRTPVTSVVWSEPSAAKLCTVALGSGSTAMLPSEPTPTKSLPSGPISMSRFTWPFMSPNTPLSVSSFCPEKSKSGLRSSIGVSSTVWLRAPTLRMLGDL